MEKRENCVSCVESERPKNRNWDTDGCPFLWFGDDDSAEYDLDKIKKFFSRFKKKDKKKDL